MQMFFFMKTWAKMSPDNDIDCVNHNIWLTAGYNFNYH